MPAYPQSPAELDAWVAESTRAQGLPFHVQDPATIGRVVALLTASGWPPPIDQLDADQLAEAA
jgi:hypothetical protein